MDFEFSDRYQPLFDLLSTWEILELNNPDLSKKEKDEILESNGFEDIADVDFDYFNKLKKVDTVMMSGGRDSGKSFALSTFNCIAASDYSHRIMYTRHTMSSTDNSITTALNERMVALGVEPEFQFANNNYTLRDDEDGARKGKITISGQKTSSGKQTAKLKSLEDYSIFETDEGEEIVSFDEWKKVKRSMRAKDVQTISIISFNPPTREHWLAEEFYEEIEDGFNGIVDNVMYIHTTYFDNGKENMAEQNWNEYELLRLDYELYESTPNNQKDSLPKKVIKNAKEYRHAILGGFLDAKEGVIYEDWEIGEFPEDIPFVHGQDFGSSDPDATTKIALDFDNMRAYIHQVHFKSDAGTAHLMQALHEKVGYSSLIYADSASRRMIRDYQDGMYSPTGEWLSGINIEPVRKSKGAKLNFVEDSIKKCQDFTLVFTPESVDCIRAVRNYCWHDKRSGVPDHYLSDLPDSWRYGIVGMLNDR